MVDPDTLASILGNLTKRSRIVFKLHHRRT
jgi:hypothetical protein